MATVACSVRMAFPASFGLLLLGIREFWQPIPSVSLEANGIGALELRFWSWLVLHQKRLHTDGASEARR